MSFVPVNDFRIKWTNRQIKKFEPNTIFYQLGDNSGVSDLVQYGEYRILDPSTNVRRSGRTRNAQGGLTDFTSTDLSNEPGISFVTVKPNYLQDFSQQVDYLDLPRVPMNILAEMLTANELEAGRWIDDSIVTYLNTGNNIPATNKMAKPSGTNIAVRIANGQVYPSAANNSQRNSLRDAVVGIFDFLNTLQADLEADPSLANRDTAVPRVIIPPKFKVIIDDAITRLGGDTAAGVERIADRAIRTNAPLGNPYQFTFKGIDVFTSGNRLITPSDPGQDFQVFAFFDTPYDAAVSSRAFWLDPASALTAKNRMREEIELAVKVTEPRLIYRFDFDAVA